MVSFFGKGLAWGIAVTATIAIAPAPVDGQVRQSAERIRSVQDIYPAEQLWNAAQARTRSVDNNTLERQKEKVEAELEQDNQLVEIMEAMGGDGFDFSMNTEFPSSIPSDGPSLMPSTIPSDTPSLAPTMIPSEAPSVVESAFPTISEQPTHMFWPSFSPSESAAPSSSPSLSAAPSDAPSLSLFPSSVPSVSAAPSAVPSVSLQPSIQPSLSTAPSVDGATKPPTMVPSENPTAAPTTAAPTSEPSGSPTTSASPSSSPTLSNCPGITSQQRIAEITRILIDLARDRALLLDLSTPQGKATNWLLNRDFDQTCPDDEKLVQRWALAVMYYSTNGDDWDQCSALGADPCGEENPFLGERRFLSSFDECDWAGITCSANGCVTEVEFENNNLIGTIPTEVALLTDLAVWGMERGGLTGTIPTEVGTLTNLVFLDFDFNQLSGSLPSELYLLTGLEQLDLNDNQLTGNVDQMGALSNLEFLQLHANGFTGTLPNEMGNLSLMRTCTIHRTLFSGTMPLDVCALRDINGGRLRSLIAECDDIPGVGPQIVCETPDCCSDCRGL